jgi:hypothetical protein
VVDYISKLLKSGIASLDQDPSYVSHTSLITFIEERKETEFLFVQILQLHCTFCYLYISQRIYFPNCITNLNDYSLSQLHESLELSSVCISSPISLSSKFLFYFT